MKNIRANYKNWGWEVIRGEDKTDGAYAMTVEDIIKSAKGQQETISQLGNSAEYDSDSMTEEEMGQSMNSLDEDGNSTLNDKVQNYAIAKELHKKYEEAKNAKNNDTRSSSNTNNNINTNDLDGVYKDGERK